MKILISKKTWFVGEINQSIFVYWIDKLLKINCQNLNNLNEKYESHTNPPQKKKNKQKTTDYSVYL